MVTGMIKGNICTASKKAAGLASKQSGRRCSPPRAVG
jgi:hypothetical protein